MGGATLGGAALGGATLGGAALGEATLVFVCVLVGGMVLSSASSLCRESDMSANFICH